MKTDLYIFTTWEAGAMAAGSDSGLGGERQAALVRQSEGTVQSREEEKVIDLTGWRAADSEGPEDEVEDELDWGEPEAERTDEEPPAHRPRRSHRAMLAAELVSTLSVVAVAVAIIVRVLTF